LVRMIIADDELLIRQGLQSIPWKDYGVEIKGVAANGEEALSLIRSTYPDILLTDIKMPRMDGLKLISSAKAYIPGMKTILLTGYEDFNYAHTAIKIGAFGYVLKPSDLDSIIDIVLKAKEQVESEQKEKQEMEDIRQKIGNTKSIMRNSFLQDLIYGRNTDAADISVKCAEFGLALDNYVIMTVEFAINDEKPDSELTARLKEALFNVVSYNNRSFILDISYSVCCIIIEVPAAETSVKDRMLSLALEMRNYIKSEFDLYCSVGISRYCKDAANMHAVFNQAMNCLKMRFSLGKCAVIHIEDLKDSIKRCEILPLVLDDEIIENIKNGNYGKVENLTRELLFRLSKEQKADEQMIKSICFDILSSALKILKSDKAHESAEISEQQLYSMLADCTVVEELEESMISMLMNIMDLLNVKTHTAKNKVIEEVMAYIEKHYMEDISLLAIAANIHMNHIYISRLIKKETGETFLDILTRTRMVKACELLTEGSYMTYEISKMIGIKDSGYFSQVFKKYTGVTPSEYRDKYNLRQMHHKETL
jgi:two-component system response regulator YesN